MRKGELMDHEVNITARYAETDQMGIVHHSVYPIWFEVARTEFIKTSGITYTQLEKDGVMLPLSELTCKYIYPVHYEDNVTIRVNIEKLSFAKITFGYKVILDGRIMSEGTTTHGFVDSKTFRPVSIKKVMPEFYEKLKLTAEK